MSSTKTTLKALTVTASVAAALAIGAGTASALTVAPIAGGTKIEVNSGEAAALAPLQAGWALDRIWPDFYDDDGLSLGDDAQRYLRNAASSPTGVAGIDVYGPLHDPEMIDVYWVD